MYLYGEVATNAACYSKARLRDEKTKKRRRGYCTKRRRRDEEATVLKDEEETKRLLYEQLHAYRAQGINQLSRQTGRGGGLSSRSAIRVSG